MFIKHVLVVEDNEHVRSLIVEVLSGMNIRVHVAQNGNEGLALAGEYSPDLIVTDVNMSGMDGITMIATLRERGYRNPVIVISADVGKYEFRFRELGHPTRVVSKPFDLTTFVRYVEESLSH